MAQEPRLPSTTRPLSRRTVLAAGAGLAGAFLLGACGGDDDSEQDTGSGPAGSDTGPPDGSELSLVAFFDGRGVLGPGRTERVAFGLGDLDGALLTDGPDELVFQLNRDGMPVGPPITAPRRNEGLQRAYYPMVFEVAEPGFYEVGVEGTDPLVLPAAFEVSAAEDVRVPAAGEPMPVVDTPTSGDPRGVDPICTAEPMCPLHEVNLRDSLTAGRRVALLISTPAFCQTAICGPVLDVLLAERGAFAEEIDFVHAEVFRNADEARAEGAAAETTATVQALQLPFEPSLVLIAADGTVAARLDTIYDRVELQAALTALTS